LGTTDSRACDEIEIARRSCIEPLRTGGADPPAFSAVRPVLVAFSHI